MKGKESIIASAMIILIVYTMSLSFVSQAFPADQTSKTVSSTGSIQIQTSAEIGIYSDSQCVTPLSTISWGVLEPGTNQNITCYIKNEGITSTTFSLENSNWNPSMAADYLTLSWNYDNQSINPSDSLQVTFTLTVDPNIIGITTFNFDITIVGSS